MVIVENVEATQHFLRGFDNFTHTDILCQVRTHVSNYAFTPTQNLLQRLARFRSHIGRDNSGAFLGESVESS
jgi:hypothetical protein